jgi:hypothetical protein
MVMTNSSVVNSSDFIFGQLCAYDLQWPESAVEGDKMYIKANDIAEGAQVYVAAGVAGMTSGEKQSEEQLFDGKSLLIKYPS